ncbi:MAG: preprotein translocase subunit SecA, partial [Actinobacteria bacterium]|nr:preprotein translocase subunit SecA [Actinomycetota bacterium]
MPTQSLGKLEKVLRIGEGRRMKRLAQQADYIASLEPDFQKLSDEELRGTTASLRERLANGESLDELLFEAYAAVREARWRESQQRMFDVQMMGGIVLHEGDIAEMKTGEGKTFVAALALYLNALPGTGVHLVTVNDYLAKRDAEWNEPVFDRLGVTVGFIQNMMPFAERRDAYAADITYGTNSEFGFDYLRDNMAVSREGLVQRSHSYAIVDEVDSILIDEARTPLIISGEPETAATTYYDFARIVKQLEGKPATRKGEKGEDETELSGADYLYDEKHKTVSPAQSAIDKVERALKIENLYDPRNVQLVNHLIQALKAQSLYQRDVDYVIQDNEVKIVDEFTGRIMEGRRWSEGLHQAVEAKEGVRIQEENVTLATITLQNYFRLYEKLAGMTGTAKTEEKEFVEIYDLHVVEIPTNVPVVRRDENDYIFKTKEAKFAAVIDDIEQRYEARQPVLVGTIAVETSEYLSELMKRRGIPHNVLNAKEHERESEIIKDAGQPGQITIATNMAGRGVDIKLGDGVVGRGGLYVLATERHESRRIDNQLRGRSGRQGDPGETRFYLSGEDDLVRLFAGDRIKNIMERFKLPDDQPMEAKILSNQIENAQKKVEEQNFVARKNVLKYDDVMNTQRRVIYEQRRRVLDGDDLSAEVRDWIREVVERNVVNLTEGEFTEDWDLAGLVAQMQALYGTDITVEELREEVELDREALIEEFVEDALETYDEKEREYGPELMREIERYVMLQVVDSRWRSHLDSMDYLRDGIHLRAMAQKDPLVEYRAEGHAMFEELGVTIREEVVLTLFHAQIEVQGDDGAGAATPEPFEPQGPNGNL